MWQHMGRRVGLAEVVQQAGPAHRQRLAARGGGVDDQQHVLAGVDLGVVLRGLRHAEQAVELGQDHCQRAAIAQHADHARGARFHQPARELLPHAFGDQVVDLAGSHHPAHQRQGLGRDREVGEARSEARHAQDAQRVLGEGGRHVAEEARRKVALAAAGVDQRAVLGARDRVDGEVAALQVFFERDLGRGMTDEAGVAVARLALGARERVFLAGVRMQEHREVTPDRAKAAREHLFGGAADHDPVAVLDRQPEQGVAHRPADNVGLHQP